MPGSPSPRRAKRRAIIIGGSMSGSFQQRLCGKDWLLGTQMSIAVERRTGRPWRRDYGHPELMETPRSERCRTGSWCRGPQARRIDRAGCRVCHDESTEADPHVMGSPAAASGATVDEPDTISDGISNASTRMSGACACGFPGGRRAPPTFSSVATEFSACARAEARTCSRSAGYYFGAALVRPTRRGTSSIILCSRFTCPSVSK
jgi:hypothetical protein